MERIKTERWQIDENPQGVILRFIEKNHVVEVDFPKDQIELLIEALKDSHPKKASRHENRRDSPRSSRTS
jgi:hypothetical protein